MITERFKDWILKCPKCGSTNIGQFRMMEGAIWCEECKFKVEQKQIDNPFLCEF